LYDAIKKNHERRLFHDAFASSVFGEFQRIENCVELVDLEEHGRVQEHCVLKPLAGPEGLGDASAKVVVNGDIHIDLARVILARAGICQRDEIDVSPVVALIGDLAAGEEGEERQELRLSRKKALAYCLLEIAVIGSVTVLGYSVLSDVHPLAFITKYKGFDILDTLDFISNSVMMPIAAVFTTILVVAVIGLEKFSKHIRPEGKWRRQFVFQLCMCVVVIPCLLVVLLNAVGLLK